MGFVGDTLGKITGGNVDTRDVKGMRDSLGRADMQTVDFFSRHGGGQEKMDKLVDRSAYAPVTGAAQWGADQARRGAATQMNRMAAGGGAGYNPALQRAAGNAYADASGNIAQQAIGGRIEEEKLNRGLADAYNAKRMALQQQNVDAQLRAAQIQAGMGQSAMDAQQKQSAAVMGALGSAGGALFGASDERAKTDVAPGMGSVEEMLDKLEPIDFRYKPGIEDGGAQQHTGVMAQDLAASPAGAGAVAQDPRDGMLGINAAQAAPLALATAANLHQRLKSLEQGQAPQALPEDAVQAQGMPADERELAAIDVLKRRG